MIAALTPLLYSLGPAALLLVMAVVFAESGLLVGFFLPGDSLLFLAGALVASHVIGLPIWALATGVFVAALAGDQVGYTIGRRYGPRLFSRPDSRLFSRDNVDRAHAFFAAHGPKAVILARFIPVVRTFVPATAGVARMDRRRFTAYNLVGAAVWSFSIVGAGFYFGAIPFVAAHIELITIGLASLSIIPAGIAYVRNRRSRRAVDAVRVPPVDRRFVVGVAHLGPEGSPAGRRGVGKPCVLIGHEMSRFPPSTTEKPATTTGSLPTRTGTACGTRTLHGDRPNSLTDSAIGQIANGGLSTVIDPPASSAPKKNAFHDCEPACAAAE